jgi:hypothetical protein
VSTELIVVVRCSRVVDVPSPVMTTWLSCVGCERSAKSTVVTPGFSVIVCVCGA